MERELKIESSLSTTVEAKFMYDLTAEDVRKLLLRLRISIGNVTFGGEFAEWTLDKEMPLAAMKELQELEACHELLKRLEEFQDRKVLSEIK